MKRRSFATTQCAFRENYGSHNRLSVLAVQRNNSNSKKNFTLYNGIAPKKCRYAGNEQNIAGDVGKNVVEVPMLLNSLLKHNSVNCTSKEHLIKTLITPGSVFSIMPKTRLKNKLLFLKQFYHVCICTLRHKNYRTKKVLSE